MLFGALVALVTIAAAALGYFLGRRQPREEDLARIAELEGRLERAQASAETTRDDIDEHFETSAALFGKLAQDYRDLFEHWADSATRLGVSETRAGAIIDQARSRLLEDDRTVEVAADAEAEPGDTAPSATGDAASADDATTDAVDPEAAADDDAPAMDETADAAGAEAAEDDQAPEDDEAPKRSAERP